MGALRRATIAEVEELSELDPLWWPGFCGAIAEKGQVAIREERDLRGWAWGGLWGWITRDEKRYADYMKALEAYVQGLALETVGIADGGEDVKLRVDTRFKLAGKVDRERWGEKSKAEVAQVVLVDAGLVGFASQMLERLRPAERVIEPPAEEI